MGKPKKKVDSVSAKNTPVEVKKVVIKLSEDCKKCDRQCPSGIAYIRLVEELNKRVMG